MMMKRADGGSKYELHQGLEFDSAEEAQGYYNLYAARAGFKIRIGQLYRSRADGEVSSRRFVCSKEGFQTHSRTGCQAHIRVQRKKSGKWSIVTLKKEHNHDHSPPGEKIQKNAFPIAPPAIQKNVSPIHSTSPTIQKNGFPIAPLGETHPPTIQKNPFPIALPGETQNAFAILRSSAEAASTGTGIIRSQDNGHLNLTDAVDTKRPRREEGEVGGADLVDPKTGIGFDNADEAYRHYCSYAARMGFKVRIGQLFHSLITSKKFVCSRVGCEAFLSIQRQDSGRWVVDHLSIKHNHSLGSNPNDEMGQNNIGNDWYSTLLPYFESRQSVDTGFFYALEVDDGKCGSVFWADGRSRFLSSQFGDAIVFDTSYRSSSNHSVPFAFFFGVNHHKQPVLLGCALIAHESEKCFSWIFQTWIRAMSCQPLSIIAEQDMPIQRSIARVFPETHHRFSSSQVKANELQHLGPVFSKNKDFKCEYTICVSLSRTPSEFDSSWNQLLSKYCLHDNVWLKEMYQMRKHWVPLYIKGTFSAGITMDDGNPKSFFENFLNPQSPSNEFIAGYEKAVEQSREKERREDFNSFSLKYQLHTKDPMEEQGLKYYTLTMFKVFQKELLECPSYVAVRINADGVITRFMVQKCRNGMDDRNTVAINCSNLNVSCSCMMFEFEGILCGHALKIFQVMNVNELPSRYFLHRWTKNAKCGALRDMDSVRGYADARTLMLWSLREEACHYIQAGMASHEKYRLAFEILHQGRRGQSSQTGPVKP